MFEETTEGPDLRESIQSLVSGDKAMESVVNSLEEELKQARDQARNTVEQFETSTEELKASNEELQAINEELRSASEELETSKEELQSVNEELTTVNAELKDKIEEVTRVNSDLQNLMQSTDIATIFLDRSLQIKRFTPRLTEIFNIIPSDIGRPLTHVTHKLLQDTFSDEAAAVLRDLTLREREAVTEDGHVFLVRISPYRSIDDKIEGVVIAFIDITKTKRAEEALQATNEELMRLRALDLEKSTSDAAGRVADKKKFQTEIDDLRKQLDLPKRS